MEKAKHESHLGLRIDTNTFVKLRQLAESKGVSVSVISRKIIKKFFENPLNEKNLFN